jgi:hypothetical protein
VTALGRLRERRLRGAGVDDDRREPQPVLNASNVYAAHGQRGVVRRGGGSAAAARQATAAIARSATLPWTQGLSAYGSAAQLRGEEGGDARGFGLECVRPGHAEPALDQPRT